MMALLGEITFSLMPEGQDPLHLTVGVNSHDNGTAFDIVCRYTPMPGESYDYFISSTFKISMLPHHPSTGSPRFQVQDSVILRGTLSDKRSSPILHRVADDLDRLNETFNKLSSHLYEGREEFKQLLAWHLKALEKEGKDLNICVRDRGFYVVIEILGLALMGTRHPDAGVRNMAEYILGAVFPTATAA